MGLEITNGRVKLRKKKKAVKSAKKEKRAKTSKKVKSMRQVMRNLPELTVQAGDELYSIDLAKEFDLHALSPSQLEQAYINLPAQKVFLGRLLADAGYAFRRANVELQELEGVRYRSFRSYLEGKRGQYVSGREVDSLVSEADDVARKRLEVEELRYRYEILKTLDAALEHRRSALMSIGARVRDDRRVSYS